MFRARVPGVILGLASWAGSATGQSSAGAPDPAELARRIDRRLDAVFKANKVEPAPQTGDDEFLRRAYLDINGRIPRAADIHAFRADSSPDKRRRLIDQLLAEPRYAVHFANVWRAELLP